MRSVAKIAGVPEQLDQLLTRLTEGHPGLSVRLHQQGHLECVLSVSLGVDHWPEVAKTLGLVGEAIKATGVGDIGILVETHFDASLLPDGSLTTDALWVSEIGIKAMSKLDADLEILVDHPSRPVGS